jgi:hypothetical protein
MIDIAFLVLSLLYLTAEVCRRLKHHEEKNCPPENMDLPTENIFHNQYEPTTQKRTRFTSIVITRGGAAEAKLTFATPKTDEASSLQKPEYRLH